MNSRTIIALFLAATLTTLSATRSPLAASNSNEVSSTEMHLSISGDQRDVGISDDKKVNQLVNLDNGIKADRD